MRKSISKEYMVREYIEKNRTMEDLANELGVGRSSIWYAAKKYGLIGTENKKGITRGINENLIRDDNADIAYFAGLLAADGYMDRGNLITITMTKDAGKQVLTDIAERLGYTGKVVEHEATGGFSTNTRYELTINSKNLKEYLKSRYNLYGKKSDNLRRFPDNLETYPEEVQSAYMLGIFDGDGTFDVSRQRYQLTTTNESWLYAIISFINYKFDANEHIRYRMDREVHYPYILIPSKIAVRLGEWMYKYKNIHIDYKYEKFNQA